MSSKSFKISIDSILGGQSRLGAFGAEGEFKNSLAIDPDQESYSSENKSSGLLVPTPSVALGGNTLDAEPLWLNTTPKTDDVFVYDQSGKVYTAVLATNTISDLNNGVAISSSSGNGSDYYDNYNYFATNTNITRYGPLNGTRVFTNSYWTGTLGLSALGNGVTYPAPKIGTSRYPNHVMHRHVDNKNYICDVMANNGVHTGKGAIHFIKTTKTTVEGDTNDGSTYNALDLPYGVWPTDIESFGTDLAISAYEGDTTTGNTVGKKGKVYFWDTTSSSFYKVVELPDPLVSALEFVNGELIAFSGNPGDIGCRVSRFVGGYSFEEITYLEDTQPPFAGATDAIMSRVIFGGFSSSLGNYGVLWAIGSKISKITRGLFNIMRFTGTAGANATVTSVIIPENTDFTNTKYLIGWRDGTVFGIDRNATTYGVSEFQSEVFKVGKPFEVNRIRIPLNQAVGANMTIAVKVIVDEESTSTTVSTINNTNYADSERFIDIHPNVRGKHDFFFQLSWSGSSLLSVGLPIIIEGNILEE